MCLDKKHCKTQCNCLYIHHHIHKSNHYHIYIGSRLGMSLSNLHNRRSMT